MASGSSKVESFAANVSCLMVSNTLAKSNWTIVTYLLEMSLSVIAAVVDPVGRNAN